MNLLKNWPWNEVNTSTTKSKQLKFNETLPLTRDWVVVQDDDVNMFDTDEKGRNVNKTATLEEAKEFIKNYNGPHLEAFNEYELGLVKNQLLKQKIGEDEAKVEFYGNPMCPFAHRVWLALTEKEVSFKYHPIILRIKKPAGYLKLNPKGEVPTLIVDGKIITESGLINEFLEHKFSSGTQLLPKSALDKADIRLFLGQFQPVVKAIYVLLKGQDRSKDEENRKTLHEKLQKINEILKSRKGPFFLGHQVSLAEVNTWPFLARHTATLKEYRGTDLLEGHDSVKTWYEAMSKRKAFQRTTQATQNYLFDYSKYAAPREIPKGLQKE